MIGNRFSITKKKYKNVRCEIDGIKFDSKAEAEYYALAKLCERNGTLKILEIQPKVYLTRARILFVLDFLIQEKSELVYIEIKGFETPVYKIKKRLWCHYGIGKLRVIKKDKLGFKTVEEIQANTGV